MVDSKAEECSSNPFDESFDKIVAMSLEQYKVPGTSVAIVDGNSTYAKGYGFADLPNKKASPDTLYFIGSLTKSFTAASILMLTEDMGNQSTESNQTDLLSLTTPISSIIDFKVPDEYVTSHATLEDALSHRTGMPRHEASYGGPNFTEKDTVALMRHLPMTSEIRQKFQYCNLMYAALSVVIETITGRKQGDFYRDRIWKPLSMNSTLSSLEKAREYALTRGSTIAKGYFWDDNLKSYHIEPYMSENSTGQTLSTVKDYAKWLRALMEENQILSKQSHKTFRQPRSILQTENTPFAGSVTYGLGLTFGVYRNYEFIHHNGSILGFGSYMAFIPQRKWGVVVLANSDIRSNILVQHLAFELADRVLGTPEDQKIDWPKKHDEMLLQMDQRYQNARSRIYPDLPESNDTLPPSLPLDQYAGSYWNPGYRNLNFKFSNSTSSNEGTLSAESLNRFLPHNLVLEHVTGNFFIARMSSINGQSSLLLRAAFAAEFRIGSNGKVEELGIAYNPGLREKIWFKKAE